MLCFITSLLKILTLNMFLYMVGYLAFSLEKHLSSPFPLIWGIQNNQAHGNREYNSGCQELKSGGIGKLLFQKYTISVMLDGYILEICCAT